MLADFKKFEMQNEDQIKGGESGVIHCQFADGSSETIHYWTMSDGIEYEDRCYD